MKTANYTEKEKELIYNYMKEQIPDAMELLDRAIMEGMPYEIIERMTKDKISEKVSGKVLAAINWRYKQLVRNTYN